MSHTFLHPRPGVVTFRRQMQFATKRSPSRLSLDLVLVLEFGPSGVFESCVKSKLHPATAGLEMPGESQTSPHRLKLREATAGKPLYKMAALSVAGRRLPGMTQRKVLPVASILVSGYNGP